MKQARRSTADKFLMIHIEILSIFIAFPVMEACSTKKFPMTPRMKDICSQIMCARNLFAIFLLPCKKAIQVTSVSFLAELHRKLSCLILNLNFWFWFPHWIPTIHLIPTVHWIPTGTKFWSRLGILAGVLLGGGSHLVLDAEVTVDLRSAFEVESSNGFSD